MPIARVFDVIFGSSWRQEEEVLFTCVDGYQPSIAVADLLRNRAYLAFGIKGRHSFSVDNKLQAEKNVPLGPLYLVWDNVRKPALRVEGAVSWPYQVQEVAFIRFAEKFPKLAPKPDAPKQVREGFMKFRKHCFSCHAIDGEGGNKGPDLAGITQVKDIDTLKKWVLDPQSFKPESTMPALNKLLEDREKTLDQILAFLGTKTL
jgi:mono/diheme cytochrome c family protein